MPKLTDAEQATLFYDRFTASQREKADASRKLRTVYDILAVLECEGAREISTQLVRALLQPTKEALNTTDNLSEAKGDDD